MIYTVNKRVYKKESACVIIIIHLLHYTQTLIQYTPTDLRERMIIMSDYIEKTNKCNINSIKKNKQTKNIQLQCVVLASQK